MHTIKTAFVSGADRGLGLALCTNLLARGFRVFAGSYAATLEGRACRIGREELDRLTSSYPDRLIILPLDIGDTSSVKEAAKRVGESAGRLDLLICNAAILGDTEKDLFQEWDEDDFDLINRVYNVNTTGTLRVITALAGKLDNASRLIIISSEAGQIPQEERESWFGYCCSKAAVNSLGSLAANGLKKKGVAVLLFHPGWMRTYMEGEKNTRADLEPEDSARGILEFALERCRRSFGFFDYTGGEMAW